MVVFLAASAAAMSQTYGGGSVPARGVRAGGGSIRPSPRLDTHAATTMDEGLRQAFERATYSLKDSGHGTAHTTWSGENPAQRLTFEFNEREARLSHPEGSVAFHLTGYGYGDRLQKPARAILIGAGNRIEYRRGDLTEWYVNGRQGLEQGFTLAHRAGTDPANDPLVIALGVTGGLVPVQAADQYSVQFESGKSVVLRYGGLMAVDARGHTVPSRMEVRDREIRLIVEDQGAEYPLIIDPTWTQQQKLTASDIIGIGDFGNSVSVSGNTAEIGAPGSNGYLGAAYIFVRSGGVWTQQQELMASDGAPGDQFGNSVSVFGDTAVIGASYKNGRQGAAYVFVRSAGVWTQQQELTASDGAAADFFGSSVGVSGDTAVIADYEKNVGRNTGQGVAYVFARSGGVWSQQQELTASDGAANDFFGISVSVSGDTAVIGAYGKNAGQGAAYVFVLSAGVWSQQQELTASGGIALDGFGSGVAVSGDTAVIGAPGKNSDVGAGYVFVSSGGVWSQRQELTASDGVANDYFGISVSLSGDTAVIGALTEGDDFSVYQGDGAAYLFVRSGAMWTQQQKLTASDGVANDRFGYSVSVSGNTALIGAFNKNSAQGAAYIFAGASLGTNAILVSSASGGSSVELSTSSAWTAIANGSFLHISAGSASGTGSAMVVFTYDSFTGAGSRTGTLTVAGLTVTVTQAGTNYIGPGIATTLSSAFEQPEGIAADGFGNVYIADRLNGAIRKWNTSTQQLTTVVTGLAGPYDVAVDSAGNVYIADGGDSTIKEWSASTQQLTTLVATGLNGPEGVAVDSFGNVYIADFANNAIKEWNASTGQVTTLVSTGSYPVGVAVDGLGNVYFSEPNANVVMEWSASTQQVTTLISTGLLFPAGVAVDGSGNVYIADFGNNAIEEWSASTQQVTTLVAYTVTTAPEGVAVDGSGNVYFTSTWQATFLEIPYAFVGPAILTEPPSAGDDALLPVLPSTTSLTGIFAPSSDSSWLSGVVINGTFNFDFTANSSTLARRAHITILNQRITVTQNGQASQSISFQPLVSQVFGIAPFTVSATATSGLAVSFGSTTQPVCTVSGATVTLVTVGMCTIQATQLGDSDYAAATPVSQSFQVQAPTGPLQITTGSVPVASQYQSYNTTLAAAGGVPPYAWSVVSSTGVSLPEGMSLDPATGIVGAAQVNGQGGYAVIVQVADSDSPTPNVVTTTLNFGVNSDSTYGGCQMFPADSIFNQRIDSLPVDTNPSHQIPASYLSSPLHPDFGGGFYPGPGGIPFMRVPANQGASNVNLANSGQIDAAGTYQWPFPAWPNALIEGTLYGPSGNDHHMLILQSSVNNISGPQTGACTLYETYQGSAVPSMYDAVSNTWSMVAGTHYLLNSDEIAASESTLDTGAQDSAGIPILPLLIKYSEVPLGVQHPLRINFPVPTNGFVWPATGCCGASGPPEGLLYRLQASVNWQAVCPASTNPQAATVLQALQQYGAYTSNHGTAGYIEGVPDVRWDDNDLGCIKSFLVSNLEVVDNSGLEVSDISGQTQPYVVPATLASGTVGTAYGASIAEVGGNPSTLRWSISAGALPPGLALNASTGAIVGTPGTTAESPYSFGITVTDTASGLASQAQTFAIGVTPGTQTINFGIIPDPALSIPPFMVSATATSGLPVSFNSQTMAICTVSGATVTLVAVGTCTIQATQGGSGDWAAAPPVNQSLQVTQGSQTITFGTLASEPLGTLPFTVSATATSGLPVSFNSQTMAICTVSGATVTLVAVGTCTVQATVAATTNWAAAPPVNQSFQVTQGSPGSQSGPGSCNPSGSITVANVQLIINEALGVASAVDDLNADGVVNVVDVQIQIDAVLGCATI